MYKDKAILVIDMPDICFQCPFCKSRDILLSYDYFCVINDEEVDKYRKPDWCPLKPLPDKRNEIMAEDYINYVAYGWNCCINEITSTK